MQALLHAIACNAIHARTFAMSTPSRAIQGGMENEWRERLEAVISADRRSLRAISKEAGFGENYVQQMLKDEKQPTFPRLAKVLSVLGARATVYVTTGIAQDPDSQMRSALLSFGVDRDDISLVMSMIKGFVEASPALQSEQDPDRDQFESSTARHEVEP